MGKQKRSTNTYQKINTIFYRDENNIIMPYDEFVMPDLEFLRNCKFDAEEKIDGTNIRIEVTRELTYYVDQITTVDFEETDDPHTITWSVSYKGKTDNADIPKKLLSYLKTEYPEDKVLNALGLKKVMNVDDEFTIAKEWTTVTSMGRIVINTDKVPFMYTLYGEGFGAGIQSGGYYTSENRFIGFDVKVNDLYLLRANRDDIFNKLGAPIVPFIGQFTIDEAIEFVKKGFNSRIAKDEHLAEGLVLRTSSGLRTRRGERIMFKVKTCDWVKYFNKYKTYDKVEQKRNPKANLE